MVRARGAWCALVLGAAAWPVSAVGLFKINLIPGAALQANPLALQAFDRAAAEWEAYISTPIKVNNTADLGTFTDPSIIGATGYGSENLNLDYTTVRDRLVARAARPGNQILNYIPDTAHVKAIVPTGATFDNTTIGLTRANQKALGLIASTLTDNVVDGQITFNQAYTFDYDSRDGVDANKIDFQTAAAHEIGHVLGFLSDTDDYDAGVTSDNATTLDLFRFNTTIKPTTFEEFAILPRELRPGEEAVITDLSGEYRTSTGQSLGDGRQASHWKDDQIFDTSTGSFGPLIGIMDPTLDHGTIESVGPADLRAMELIGYDTPEPGGMMLVAGAIGMLAQRQRHRPLKKPETRLPHRRIPVHHRQIREDDRQTVIPHRQQRVRQMRLRVEQEELHEESGHPERRHEPAEPPRRPTPRREVPRVAKGDHAEGDNGHHDERPVRPDHVPGERAKPMQLVSPVEHLRRRSARGQQAEMQ
jgi:hypothetical protein